GGPHPPGPRPAAALARRTEASGAPPRCLGAALRGTAVTLVLGQVSPPRGTGADGRGHAARRRARGGRGLRRDRARGTPSGETRTWKREATAGPGAARLGAGGRGAGARPGA